MRQDTYFLCTLPQVKVNAHEHHQLKNLGTVTQSNANLLVVSVFNPEVGVDHFPAENVK